MLFTDASYGAKLGRLHPVVRYFLGLSLFAAALAARFALTGVLPPHGFPFLTFFPAVLLTAFLAGLGPGLLVSALSVVSAWYFFVTPIHTFVLSSAGDQIALVFFAAILLIDCVVIHLMNAAMAALQRNEAELRQRSKALRQSEIRLQTLTEHSPGAIAIFDRQMRYMSASRRWLHDHGAGDADVTGRSHYEVFPYLPDQWRDAHRRGLAGEVVRSEGDRFMFGDGAVRWLRWELWPWHDDAGQVGGIVIASEDITERVVAEEALRVSEEKYRTLFTNVNEGFAVCEIIVDAQGRPYDYRYLLLNPAFERLNGYAPGAADGRTVREMAPETAPCCLEMFAAVALTGEPEMRDEYIDSLGKWYSARAFGLGDGRFAYLLADITESKLAQERVRQAALHDPLTGLPNRALVFEYARHMLAAARRTRGRGALLFIDLDRFKPINDLHGHEAGDAVLKEVSERLVRCTRDEDVVGRLGGDEFVVILPHLDANRQRAATVAQHLIDSIRQPVRANDLELTISPSIGISYYPEHADDVSSLIHTADMAMYEAKRSGRATYRFYTPELDRRAEQALHLEARLKNALRQDGFRLHYQPVVDVQSGRLLGAEALVRLADGAGVPVGPGEFIPVAEASGLIVDLGAWVAAEACRQHQAWLAQGLELTIAINVSPIQFRQQQFAGRLHQIIADTGIDPSRLEIEVTESAVMENIDEAIGILNQIKALGAKVALDDFGTGYSSLSTLTSLPLDKLKVDQSFVRRLEQDAASRAVTAAVIAMGRSLRLDVHGEGIETESALRYLQQQGCQQAQGYWFSAPLPASEFARWCRMQPVT